MIDKRVATVEAAVADVKDGSTVMIGGFGAAGMPNELIDALIAQGARDLTVVNNNAGNGYTGLAALLKAGLVRKIICSFPRQVDSYVFDELYRAGRDRTGTGSAGQPGRAHPCRRRRHRRLFHAHRLRHRCWPKARRPARSTAATTCWSIRSMPTWR